MTAQIYRDLAWLVSPPATFRQECQAIEPGSEPVGRALRRLSNHALTDSGLRTLARTIARLADLGADFRPLTPFRLGLVGNSTLDLLAPALIASAVRHGILLSVVQADFGQLMQEAISPQSRINQAGVDAVLIALDHHAFAGLTRSGSVDAAIGMIAALRNGFHANGVATCIVQTIAPPAESHFGNLDRIVASAPRFAVDAINRALADEIADSPDVLFDVAAMAETVGLANWQSPAQWNMAKLAFDQAYLPWYADALGRLLGALKGKSRRCLILDLDNTLWGGVIGDDGMDGIRIAQGDPVGEAFLHTQATALALRERGIVLAVSSKNTDAIARQVFREHPDMVLREDHLAAFQANWNDKATNITAIAEALSLGLESMVFLDDNPVERALIRQMLPDVAVPELPEDPALYARTLLAAGYFETISFSEEDRGRADFYQRNAQRVALRDTAGDLDGYLQSLDMVMTIAPFDASGRARIAQLIAKSNQFNLTTRRYSEADVAVMQDDPDILTLQIRLTDTFGDNGMISVVICRPADPDTWDIDTWLMSCRVLGRKVEQAVLGEILGMAKARGIRRITGTYIPTERNVIVADHYANLGFSRIDTVADDGRTVWSLDVDAALAPVPIEIRYAGAYAMAPAS